MNERKKMHLKEILAGSLLCLVAVTSWGGMFHLMEHALTFVDPFYITSIRYLVAALLFLGILVWLEGPASLKLDGRGVSLWLLGTAGFGGFGFLVFLGQQKISGHSGAVTASVIMATMPLMTAILLWVTSGRRPALYTVVSLLVALGGVLLVITQGHLTHLKSLEKSILADATIVLGAMCWVLYTWGGNRFPGWSALRYTALSCALGTASILGITLFATTIGYLNVPTPDHLFSILWEMIYMILIAGIAGVFAWNRGTRILGPLNGVLFINLVPVTTLFLAVVSGEKVVPGEFLGALLVIGALFLNNLFQRKGLR